MIDVNQHRQIDACPIRSAIANTVNPILINNDTWECRRKSKHLDFFRHTFAVHVLQKWIKEEADLSAMLPILSTYMGHKSVRSTAQYLRLTAEVYPDLMKKVEKSCAYVIPEVCHERN